MGETGWDYLTWVTAKSSFDVNQIPELPFAFLDRGIARKRADRAIEIAKRAVLCNQDCRKVDRVRQTLFQRVVEP